MISGDNKTNDKNNVVLKEKKNNNINQDSAINTKNSEVLKKTEFVEYVDKIANAFSLKYPKGWYLESEPGGKVHVVFSPDEKSNNRFSVVSTPLEILESKGNKYNQKILRKRALKAIEKQRELHGEIEVLKNEDFSVANSKGVHISVSYTSKMTGLKMITRQIVLLNKKNMEFINIDFLASEKDSLEPIFDKMIKSYRSLR